MKHLSGSLIAKPEVEREESFEDVRYKMDDYGEIKEVKSSKQCCVCHEYLWVEQRGLSTHLREGFKVVSPLAYVGGTPDYLKKPDALLECHNTCKDGLIKLLTEGHFLA